jgi:hypothetical protein
MNEIYETVYDHVSGEDYCTATATERWSKNMFNKLKEKYPNAVTIKAVNPDGSMVVQFPYSWFPKIRPKKKRNMSEDQKKAAAERLSRVREMNLHN